MPSTPKWIALAALLVAAGCNETQAKPDKPLAPSATALAPAKPASMEAKKLTVDKGSSKVDFVMEAPFEKIYGHVPGTTTGDLDVDFMDVTKSTGTIDVDLDSLVIVQAKAEKEGQYGPETKVDKQNEHARQWLEIEPSDKDRATNKVIRFSIKSIEATGEKNITKLTGAERKVALKVTGDFLLHGRKAEKVADIDATFRFEGDKPVSVTLKTTKPFPVSLAEHEVHAHDPLGKTLSALAPKVAKEAMVSLDLTAKLPN